MVNSVAEVLTPVVPFRTLKVPMSLKKILLEPVQARERWLPSPPFVGKIEQNRHMILGVTKLAWEVFQVDRFLRDGVTGFVPDHDIVNPRLMPQAAPVCGTKRSVPGVDGQEPPPG